MRRLAPLVLALLLLGACKHGSHKKHGAGASAADERGQCARGRGRVIASLREPLLIEAYVTRGTPELDAYVDKLAALLDDLQKSTKGKLGTAVIEANDEATRAAAEKLGLQKHLITVGHDDTSTGLTGYVGLVLRYRGATDTVPALDTNDQGLEQLSFAIGDKIRQLRDQTDGTKLEVGVLAGHNEIKLSEPNLTPGERGPSVQSLMHESFKSYAFHPVDLTKDKGPIDDTLDILLITQPSTDLSEDELRRVDAFVMQGKSLVVFAGAVNVGPGDAAMPATLSTHGLEKLLLGYGVEMNADAVLDFGASFKIEDKGKDGQTNVYTFPPFVVVTADASAPKNAAPIDPTFVGFHGVDKLDVPLPSSLKMHADKQPHARLRVRARTSTRAGRIVGTAALGPLTTEGRPRTWEAPREPAQYDVAISAEGKLDSAFGEGSCKKSCRVMVLASPQFLANPMARATDPQDRTMAQLASAYLNQDFRQTFFAFKNILDWSGDQTDLVPCQSLLFHSEASRTRPPAPPKPR